MDKDSKALMEVYEMTTKDKALIVERFENAQPKLDALISELTGMLSGIGSDDIRNQPIRNKIRTIIQHLMEARKAMERI